MIYIALKVFVRIRLRLVVTSHPMYQKDVIY